MTAAPVIVGLGGSPGGASTTGLLLRTCLDQLASMGAETEIFDGDALGTLPIYTMPASPTPASPTPASRVDDPPAGELERAMLAAVRRADAIIIATPGYHGGMSGLVKNALDHLEGLRDDERPYLDGRAAGVIVSAAGWQAAGSALVSVRSTIHALRGWPTPFGVTVNSVEQRPDADGRFDERIEGALSILAGHLMEFAGWRAAARVADSRH